MINHVYHDYTTIIYHLWQTKNWNPPFPNSMISWRMASQSGCTLQTPVINSAIALPKLQKGIKQMHSEHVWTQLHILQAAKHVPIQRPIQRSSCFFRALKRSSPLTARRKTSTAETQIEGVRDEDHLGSSKVMATNATTLWWTNIAIDNGHRNSGFSH